MIISKLKYNNGEAQKSNQQRPNPEERLQIRKTKEIESIIKRSPAPVIVKRRKDETINCRNPQREV